MSIDVTLLPKVSTEFIVKEITKLGLVVMRVLIAESELEAELATFIPRTAQDFRYFKEAREVLEELRKVRAEGVVSLISMANEYNSRDDKPMALPVPEILFNYLEA